MAGAVVFVMCFVLFLALMIGVFSAGEPRKIGIFLLIAVVSGMVLRDKSQTTCAYCNMENIGYLVVTVFCSLTALIAIVFSIRDRLL